MLLVPCEDGQQNVCSVLSEDMEAVNRARLGLAIETASNLESSEKEEDVEVFERRLSVGGRRLASREPLRWMRPNGNGLEN